MQKFSIGNVNLPGPKGLFLIAGPCLVEGRQMAMEVAAELDRIREEMDIPVIFKGSYRKANRSSASSFTGIGDREALEILTEVRSTYGMPVLTDVHETGEVELAAQYVDVLQIPAFLCRQTDLLVAAAATGLTVNIKKGQFLAPGDMAYAAEKAASTGNRKIMLTERGTTFGYHNLVVDFRALPIMGESGWPVVFDATHSVQLPGAASGVSGGDRRFLLPLARAAVATGVDGLFFEVHPDPSSARSDAATQVRLDEFAPMVRELLQLQACVQSIHSR
ncbi:MAG: 3-deoxy-8-phosphooctulonate synthase [Chlorobiaceae bacterium]|nr:3-deoxy-8-phosphooctulonate synthase [Chlorobiales bacterium]NTU91928.1 3-deoxy-8-phosphooctulonate synthase [Chlorobiaceae bacterium]NTV24622.1 3-deoxy-8-phosphooctulonate synthase [Chlorobiaceae bacterium]